MMALRPSATPQIVLVVEDEMLLRMQAVNMVEDAGYSSIETVDADEAFAVLKSRADIALLFTDVQMPGSMDGLQLAHEVSKHWPAIKIILVSGQLKLSGNDMPTGSRFFAKPLESGKMAAEMQNMMGPA
ncbi:response regulator [Bradyrhizobium sp. dw_78]|uniref:response regulator n=1 Tax=Bradyrhizobium sp. dw_78 TaxID=2719793 RepID=UPI00201C4989|nr:response regulator [Bradyrhizobium sp. dw_78]